MKLVYTMKLMHSFSFHFDNHMYKTGSNFIPLIVGTWLVHFVQWKFSFVCKWLHAVVTSFRHVYKASIVEAQFVVFKFLDILYAFIQIFFVPCLQFLLEVSPTQVLCDYLCLLEN
jgi:hypothetical protein